MCFQHNASLNAEIEALKLKVNELEFELREEKRTSNLLRQERDKLFRTLHRAQAGNDAPGTL